MKHLTAQPLFVIFVPLFLFAFFIAGCAQALEPASIPTPQLLAPLILSSSAFASGAAIPMKYSCDDSDVNPPFSWSGVPEGTKSFALIISDPDAVAVVGRVVDHWVVWNIPGDTRIILEKSLPAGASQGKSYDARRYQGPCPPSGTTHRYFFKLYALDVEHLDLPTSTTGAKLEATMQGHILEQAEMTGRYTAR